MLDVGKGYLEGILKVVVLQLLKKLFFRLLEKQSFFVIVLHFIELFQRFCDEPGQSVRITVPRKGNSITSLQIERERGHISLVDILSEIIVEHLTPYFLKGRGVRVAPEVQISREDFHRHESFWQFEASIPFEPELAVR